jgi:(4-(4-[2-(gamma-L-glutamylamino)ethyl]phenoxymethyl)furan-2-yl)methanamine synthase
LAKWFAERQLRDIADAMAQVLSDGRLSDDAPIVAAGVGADVLRELSRRFGRPHRDFGDLIGAAPSARTAAAQFAPAAALAVLASSL